MKMVKADEAYENAISKCNDLGWASKEPDYSASMSIAIAEDGMVSVDEYVMFVQLACAVFQCLEFIPYNPRIEDGAFCMSFTSTLYFDRCFRIMFPIEDKDAFGGDRYKFLDRTYDNAFHMVYAGPRMEYVERIIDGDFSNFEKIR